MSSVASPMSVAKPRPLSPEQKTLVAEIRRALAWQDDILGTDMWAQFDALLRELRGEGASGVA